VTALFSFASPTNPETLRGWLLDLLVERARRVALSGLPDRDAFAALNLPDIIMSDGGAVAMKEEAPLDTTSGSPVLSYRFSRPTPVLRPRWRSSIRSCGGSRGD
jgi:hypothetical protein